MMRRLFRTVDNSQFIRHEPLYDFASTSTKDIDWQTEIELPSALWNPLGFDVSGFIVSSLNIDLKFWSIIKSSTQNDLEPNRCLSFECILLRINVIATDGNETVQLLQQKQALLGPQSFEIQESIKQIRKLAFAEKDHNLDNSHHLLMLM